MASSPAGVEQLSPAQILAYMDHMKFTIEYLQQVRRTPQMLPSDNSESSHMPPRDTPSSLNANSHGSPGWTAARVHRYENFLAIVRLLGT